MEWEVMQRLLGLSEDSFSLGDSVLSGLSFCLGVEDSFLVKKLLIALDFSLGGVFFLSFLSSLAGLFFELVSSSFILISFSLTSFLSDFFSEFSFESSLPLLDVFTSATSASSSVFTSFFKEVSELESSESLFITAFFFALPFSDFFSSTFSVFLVSLELEVFSELESSESLSITVFFFLDLGFTGDSLLSSFGSSTSISSTSSFFSASSVFLDFLSFLPFFEFSSSSSARGLLKTRLAVFLRGGVPTISVFFSLPSFFSPPFEFFS